MVSLTLTPMMCGRFIRPAAPVTHGFWGRLDRAIRRVLDAVVREYAWTLDWALRHRRLMLLVTVATVALTVELYRVVPKGFIPLQDTGLLQGGTLASTDISFQAMAERQREVVDVLLADPAVASVASTIGVSSGCVLAQPRAALTVSLKPLAERDLSSEQVIARLREPLSHVDGVQTFLSLGAGSAHRRAHRRRAVSSSCCSTSTSRNCVAGAWRLEEKLRTVPGIADVTSDQDRAGPQADVMIDRAAAARLGVAVADIDNALNNAFSQRQISRVYGDRNQYNVVLEIDPRMQTDPSMLDRVYVGATGASTTLFGTSSTIGNAVTPIGANGKPIAIVSGTTTTNAAAQATRVTTAATVVTSRHQVPLSAVAHFVRDTAPLAIRHQGQIPCATISFNVVEGTSLGEATAAVEDAARELKMPDTVRTDFAGNARYLAQSLAAEPMLIGAALLAIYIVLGVLYESLAQPLTIISTLPSAGLGALLALLVTGTELTIMAIIGIVLLMGIVKKNAIMLVDFALEAERVHGMSPQAAIHAACLERFRPIIMTTLAALLGALPLACAIGTGAELRRPLGIAVVGGLDRIADADALHDARHLLGVAAKGKKDVGRKSAAPSALQRVTRGV